MSASLNDTPWNLPIFWPNCSRSAAQLRATSRARSARPKQTAATCRRVLPSHWLATSKPPSSGPSSFEAGTRASSSSMIRLW